MHSGLWKPEGLQNWMQEFMQYIGFTQWRTSFRAEHKGARTRFEGVHRTIAHSSQFENRRRSVVSGGLSQSSSIRKERNRRRLHEALPWILAHLLSSAWLDNPKSRSKKRHKTEEMRSGSRFRLVSQGFAHLVHERIAGERLLKEETLLQEVLVASVVFEIARHVNDPQVGPGAL